jgi:hypothetical protein
VAEAEKHSPGTLKPETGAGTQGRPELKSEAEACHLTADSSCSDWGKVKGFLIRFGRADTIIKQNLPRNGVRACDNFTPWKLCKLF